MYTKRIQFDDYSNMKSVSSLLCPNCNDPALHQGAAHTFWRTMEDFETGLHTVAGQDGTTVDGDLTGNPSMRRDGTYLDMECEHCGPIFLKLAIFQHKGTTYLTWFDATLKPSW